MQVLGQLFALLTAVCWAQNSIVYGIAGRRVGSHTVAHIRLWIAFPAILVVHLLFTGSLFPLGLTPRVYGFLFLSGLMGFFVADLCIFRAFVVLGHQKTMVIMTLSPIFAAVISWLFLAESLGVLQIVGILVTVSGVGWVVYTEREPKQRTSANRKTASGTIPAGGGNRSVAAAGVALAVAGALTQAIGLALAKCVLTDAVHPVSANVIRIGGGLVGLIVFAVVRRKFTADFVRMRDRKALLLIGSGAIVGPVIGILFTLYALTLAPVGVVTTLMQVSPLILLPVDRFVFRKKIPWTAVTGTIIAVAGAALLFL